MMGDAAAFNLWTAYRTYYQCPIEVTIYQLKETGAESLIEELCQWASSRAIPYYFDSNLQRPPNSTSNRVLTSVTLADFEGLTNEKVRNDIALLRQAKRDTDKVELDNIAHSIVTACQLQLILMVPKNTTRKLEPTITGMGKRVKDYKKRIRAAKKSKSKLSEIKIISLENLERLEKA